MKYIGVSFLSLNIGICANLLLAGALYAQSIGSFATLPVGASQPEQQKTTQQNTPSQKDKIDGLIYYSRLPSANETDIATQAVNSKSTDPVVMFKAQPKAEDNIQKTNVATATPAVTTPVVANTVNNADTKTASQVAASEAVKQNSENPKTADNNKAKKKKSKSIFGGINKKFDGINQKVDSIGDGVNKKWKDLNKRPDTPEQYAVRGPIKAIYQDTKSAIAHDVPQAVANSLPWVDTNRKQENFESVLDRVSDNLNRATAADPEWAYSAQNEIRNLAKKLDTLPTPPQYRSEMSYSNYDPKKEEATKDDDYIKRPVWPGAKVGSGSVKEDEQKPFTLKNTY